MHFSRLSSLCLFTAALAAAPSLGSATDDHRHDEPVLLEHVVITASPLARSQAELAAATTVLAGRKLVLQQQPTLGETLASEVGMSSTYFGPGASRPIIRGLGGNRVRILTNTVDTLDASTVSPDHAVSVEPFLIKRIEVVRGPASLLYGSAAVGGVVNVIDHRIETDLPDRTVSGEIHARYGSNADDFTYGGITDVAVFREAQRALVIHLDGFDRHTGDTAAPDLPGGRILNTGIDSQGGSLGLSYVSETLNAGINYNGFDTVYGVPNETEVLIDLRQRRTDFAAELKRDSGILTSAKLKVGRAEYRHQENEGGEVGTTFTNRGFDSRLELLHRPLAGWSGAWGVQALRSDFSAVGEESFLPSSLTRGLAFFFFEEKQTGRFTWQIGARYEHQKIDAAPFTNFFPGTDFPARSRTDNTLSLSGGAVYSLGKDYALALSLTGTERAPNTQELFADGPHPGTGAYEIGNPGFDTEKSVGIELSLRKRTGFVTGALNLFANTFDGYLFEVPDPAAPPVLIDGEPLEVFRFVQRDALFYGAELETIWHLHSGKDRTLDLRVAADCTLAQERHGDDLPRIPPIKGSIELVWTAGPWRIGAGGQLVHRQTRVASGETETAGHSLLSADASYRLIAGSVTWELFARGSNLTNRTARQHTSFLKEIAPLPGRGVTIGVRARF